MVKFRELLEWLWGNVVPISVGMLLPRGPLVLQISIFLFGTMVAGLFHYFGAISFSCVIGTILEQFNGFIDLCFSFLDVIVRWLRNIWKLPLPGPNWKSMLICAAFVHTRAVVIELHIGGERRKTAYLTLVALALIAAPTTYVASLLDLSNSSVEIITLILAVFGFVEIIRNSILAYYRRFPATQVYWDSLRYYHRRIKRLYT